MRAKSGEEAGCVVPGETRAAGLGAGAIGIAGVDTDAAGDGGAAAAAGLVATAAGVGRLMVVVPA